MRFASLFFAFFCLFSSAASVCSRQESNQAPCPHPEQFLKRLVDAINAHRQQPISQVLPYLGFAKGTVVGAHYSHSLQPSDHPDNPRLYLVTECGSLTINLYGRTIEMAIVKQIAQSPIAGNGAHSKRAGEILVDFNQLPRERAYSVSEILNHLDLRYAAGTPTDDDRYRLYNGKKVAHDTHACSSCHVDAGADDSTGTSLGQSRIGDVDAIISPYEREPGTKSNNEPYYSIGELQNLYACRCENHADKCGKFLEDGKLPPRKPTAIAESCARLKTVLDLQPVPHCDFVP